MPDETKTTDWRQQQHGCAPKPAKCASQMTAELCKHDGKPCYASGGTADAHWRCGTAQCSPVQSQTTKMPIETAPHDGRAILVGNHLGWWIAKYEAVYQSGYRPENPWFSLMLNCSHLGLHPSLVPTHWMPMPEAAPDVR